MERLHPPQDDEAEDPQENRDDHPTQPPTPDQRLSFASVSNDTASGSTGGGFGRARWQKHGTRSGLSVDVVSTPGAQEHEDDSDRGDGGKRVIPTSFDEGVSVRRKPRAGRFVTMDKDLPRLNSKGRRSDERLELRKPLSDAPKPETTRLVARVYVLHPYHWCRQLWDFSILALVIWNALVIPYRIAMRLDRNRRDGYYWFDRGIDTIFLCDLVLNFFTGAVTAEGAVILDHKLIVKKYLTGWFAIDLVSSFPWDVVVMGVTGGSSTMGLSRLVRTAQIIRAVKLIRLARLVRLINVFSRMQGAHYINHGTSVAFKFLVVSALCLHWSACAFIGLDHFLCSPEDSWLTNHDLQDARASDVYVTALYWGVATMCTIGYGDVTAGCPETRLFSVFVMILGSSMWNYFVCYAIMVVNQQMLKTAHAIGDRMDSVTSFVKYRKMPAHLKCAIRDHFQRLNASFTSKEEIMNEHIVLTQMAPWLRKDVIYTINRHIVKTLPVFDRVCHQVRGGEALVHHIVRIMSARIYKPDEVIAREDKVGDRVFLISKGRVEVVKWNEIRVATLEDGGCVGEASFLCDPAAPSYERRRWASVYAQTYADVRSISRTRFNGLLEDLVAAGRVDREGVLAIFAERYAEVTKEQHALEEVCVADYPAVKAEYDVQTASDDGTDDDDDDEDSEGSRVLSRFNTPASPVLSTSPGRATHIDGIDIPSYYDSGVWLSPSAQKESRRYVRSLSLKGVLKSDKSKGKRLSRSRRLSVG